MVLISILSQSGPFGCCAHAGPVTMTATPASAANAIRFMLLPPFTRLRPHPARAAVGSAVEQAPQCHNRRCYEKAFAGHVIEAGVPGGSACGSTSTIPSLILTR